MGGLPPSSAVVRGAEYVERSWSGDRTPPPDGAANFSVIVTMSFGARKTVDATPRIGYVTYVGSYLTIRVGCVGHHSRGTNGDTTMKHIFKTTLDNGTTVSNTFDLPDGADALTLDAWRASGLFNATDDAVVIGRKIASAVASSATIAAQRPLRKMVDQTTADAFVTGFRLTKSVNVRMIPRAIYDTFTPDAIAFMEKDGVQLVPMDEPKK